MPGSSLPPLPGRRPPRPSACRAHRPAVFVQTSFREPALSAASQAGLVNNLNDGLAWGLFPVLFAAAGLPVGQIGIWSRTRLSGDSASSSPERCRTGSDANH